MDHPDQLTLTVELYQFHHPDGNLYPIAIRYNMMKGDDIAQDKVNYRHRRTSDSGSVVMVVESNSKGKHRGRYQSHVLDKAMERRGPFRLQQVHPVSWEPIVERGCSHN